MRAERACPSNCAACLSWICAGETVYRTTITDITERLRANQALRESEERYRELVEFSPDGIFIVREGRSSLRISAALRLCGVERAEALLGGEFAVWARPAYRRGFDCARCSKRFRR